jgi:4-hydroxybenzoate polyprenyltransferase
VLDGIVTLAIAAIAGAGPIRALQLGLAMTLLQASIGALNDLVDAPADAIGQPWKPIPAGRVTRRTARFLAAGAAAGGLLLSFLAGPRTLLVALAILAVGYAYDVRLKGTPWSWLPFAAGIPLLPVFAWVGSTATLPGVFAVLIPAAVAAGAGLALGNALVDLDEDRLAGVRSPAQVWGRASTSRLSSILLAGVGSVAAAAAVLLDLGFLTVVLSGALGAAAVVAGRWLASPDHAVRERAWQAQAAAVGGLAAVWLAAVVVAGRVGSP